MPLYVNEILLKYFYLQFVLYLVIGFLIFIRDILTIIIIRLVSFF